MERCFLKAAFTLKIVQKKNWPDLSEQEKEAVRGEILTKYSSKDLVRVFSVLEAIIGFTLIL
ncbi:MAG: hypothetical protein WD000_06995 [Thermodesulfobacteriota bacterium]